MYKGFILLNKKRNKLYDIKTGSEILKENLVNKNYIITNNNSYEVHKTKKS